VVATAASTNMAQSRFEYTRRFEQDRVLLPNTWMVVRLDGRGFTKFTEANEYQKPNDVNGIHLMNECAKHILSEFGDVVLAYGESDEYSFVLRKSCELYGRRESKILTAICSTFTAYYTFLWPQFFPNFPLQKPATFDGRIVCYPSDKNLRDYLSWRQADCHINNLFNTCFWALVHDGISKQDAFKQLNTTDSAQKNELLFSRFNINYNKLDPIFRKGSIVLRMSVEAGSADEKPKTRRQIVVIHEDLIADIFWQTHSDLLSD